MVKEKQKQRHKKAFDNILVSAREHIGKFIDRLTVEDIKTLLHMSAVVTPFVLAERKTGGMGLGGFATGLLADRLIAEKVDAPAVEIFGSSYKVNAGYAMLLAVTAFLGVNAVAGGFYALLNSANLAGQGALDAMKAQEEAQKDWLEGRITNAEYQQSKVWRK